MGPYTGGPSLFWRQDLGLESRDDVGWPHVGDGRKSSRPLRLAGGRSWRDLKATAVESLWSFFFFSSNTFKFLFIFDCSGSFFLCEGCEGYSSVTCSGFSLSWLLLLWSVSSRASGLSICGSWALGHRYSGFAVQSMWDLPGPVMKPCVPCIGRRSLIHYATREALACF